MNCSVDTHVPLEELEVKWVKADQDVLIVLFSEGESRPESQHEQYQGRAQFFPEEIHKGNFSLKLWNVKTEDKGEYMCSVHSDSQSANATTRLLELGFSPVHLSVLVFSISAPFVALPTSVPALLCIIKKDGSKRALFLHGFHVIAPCIMNFCAFVLWGVCEGFLLESYTCSAVNLLRIILLFKMAPYFRLIPDNLLFWIVKEKAVDFEFLAILSGTFSIILWEYLTNHSPNVWGKLGVGLSYGLAILLCILSVLSLGRKKGNYSFEKLVDGIPIQIVCLGQITGALNFEYFAVIMIPTLAIFVIAVLKPWCMVRNKNAYYCLRGIVFLLHIVTVFWFLDVTQDSYRESPGLMAMIAYLYTLAAISGFRHRTNLPEIPHSIVYMFGVTGMIVVNSVTVAVELIQKAKKGYRTVEDLRIILLPCESLFVIGWFTLQIYALCMEIKITRKKLEKRKKKIATTDQKEDNIPRSHMNFMRCNHCLNLITEDQLYKEYLS
ncbi:hypothetical protein MATL_G00255510 [Megalops atlanticus]|uniref:Ig-like domain-containing protein n=1 Tax=Megalops atlanticus TaxID=7932 RepID=A0A9D3P9V7_MEGAT|nr:hypothetical protein MATL_G00255510 [Megalops atlanticus]